MNVVFLGTPPANFQMASWPDQLSLHAGLTELPLFAVDGAFFFSGADAGAMELVRRSGRPYLDFTIEAFIPGQRSHYVAKLEAAPRTNYQPINCNFYDNFEAAIVTKRSVELVYLEVWGEPVTTNTQLADLKTKQTEEYVQLASGEWLRLDRIVSVDGIAAGASCRF
ncbi:MAG: hypothetical protein AAGA31_20805 [Bacteroidota bacterium]